MLEYGAGADELFSAQQFAPEASFQLFHELYNDDLITPETFTQDINSDHETNDETSNVTVLACEYWKCYWS